MPQSAARRRRSRRSPTTRSCRTATPARWSRPTARSTGCACRGSTRRACSDRCSTAGPGAFRLGPFGINVPERPGLRARDEHAGHVVEDADRLGDRPRRADDGSAPRRGHDHAAHAPARRRGRRAHAGAHRRSASRAASRSSSCASRRSTTAARRPSGRCPTIATVPTRPEPVRRSGCRPTCCSGSRPAGPGRGTCCRPGSSSTARSAGPRGRTCPRSVEEANEQLEATTRFWRNWLGARADPRPRAPPADPALGAGDQGAHVHADRGDGRGADHVAARDPGRGAQLGLPLHLDPRLDVHAAGAALPQPRLGGQRVHAVHRRPRAQRGRRRCRSCTGSTAAAT